MSPDEFEKQLDRLAVVSPRCWTEHDTEVRVRWVEELRRQFQPLDAFVWKDAVTRVIDTHRDTRSLPTPSRLTECYHEAEADRRKNKNLVPLETRFIDGRAHYFYYDGTEFVPPQ